MVGGQVTKHRVPRGTGAQLRSLFGHSLFEAAFWDRLMVVMKPLVWPFAIGSTIGALLLAAAAYQVALAFVKSRRRLKDLMHQHQHKP
jgi:hypothetical protein